MNIHRGQFALKNGGRLFDIRAETTLDMIARDVKAEMAKLSATAGDRIHSLEARFAEFEQHVAEGMTLGRRSIGGGGAASIATTLTKDPNWIAVAEKKSTRTSINVSASLLLLAVEANTITGGSGMVGTSENTGIFSPPMRKKWLRQLLRTEIATGGSVEYSRELSSINGASSQGSGSSPFIGEGELKSESSLVWELLDAKIPTVATWISASRQVLSDAKGLAAAIDNRLRFFLELEIERQIIAGNGPAVGEMSGLTLPGNHVPFVPAAGASGIDNISVALGLMADEHEAIPDLVVTTHTDYRAMQRTKAIDSGVYVWASPGVGGDVQRVWEVPIHPSASMTPDNFIVMDSVQAGTYRTREEARVETGYAGDDFKRNLVTILAEVRAIFTTERPSAVMYGPLTTP